MVNVILMLTSSILLFIGSLYVLSYVKTSVEAQRKTDFEKLVDRHVEKIKEEVGVTVSYLYGLRGKISTSQINDSEWINYIKASGLEKRYPNHLSLAYVERVNKGDLGLYIQKLKQETRSVLYGDYAVFPATDNQDVYPIKYLHTFDKDVSTLLGYDIGSSEGLSEAMLSTSIVGVETISPLLDFSKVFTGNSKTGYAIILPVYNNPEVLDLTPDERRKFLTAFVGAFIKPESLFLGVGSKSTPELAFRVSDGDVEVYKYQSELRTEDLSVVREVELLGKKYSVQFCSVKNYALPGFIGNLPKATIFGLLTLNAFWYITILGLIFARNRSQRMTKDATEDLRKFKQAVDGVSDLVIITDNLGVIIYANDAIVNTTGYSRKEIIGKKPSLWGRQMSREFYENFWKIIKTDKQPFVGELKNIRKNGEIYEVELRVWPILDDKGEVLFYVGIEHDITKTKAVERTKSEFISLASHQLRTPLSAAKWFGKMLMDGEAGELTKTQKEYLRKVNESNEREIQLVNSLLSVSRIESGKIKIEPKETDVRNLIGSVISDIEVNLQKSSRKIKFVAEKELPLMLIDPDLIRHVLVNLLTNSVRYTKENGKIDVEAKVTNGEFVVKIADDGIGVPQEEQKRLFEKFFRATNALKKETDGSGLGLYLAKTIIESSGGKIWFKSKENHGTTFWFSLPLK